jgi:hypothetical protein
MMHQMKLSGGAFESFGEATSARDMKNKDSGQSREFGFAGTSL